MDKKLPRIYVVRHGQTIWSKSGKHTGRTDVPLTKEGEEQAVYLRKYLANKNFSSVMSSPLHRAIKTCEMAGCINGCELHNDLMEWDYGDYEGLKTKDIHKTRPDWNVFLHGCPNGEKISDITLRADSVIEKIKSKKGDVLIFSHGHFSRILAVRWIGLDISFARNLLMGTATLSILGYDHSLSEPAILLWNDMDQMAIDLYM